MAMKNTKAPPYCLLFQEAHFHQGVSTQEIFPIKLAQKEWQRDWKSSFIVHIITKAKDSDGNDQGIAICLTGVMPK